MVVFIFGKAAANDEKTALTVGSSVALKSKLKDKYTLDLIMCVYGLNCKLLLQF